MHIGFEKDKYWTVARKLQYALSDGKHVLKFLVVPWFWLRVGIG